MIDTLAIIAQGGNPILDSGLLMPIAFVAIFYFLLIRPQQKAQKELKKRVSELKKGDKVITSGGIHGTVNHKGDGTISVKISEGVFITVESSNIATVKGPKKDVEKKDETPAKKGIDKKHAKKA